MDYKRIIKNPNVRYKILDYLSFVPDDIMLRLQYKIKLGRNLNLENPKRFTEFLQLYKLNYYDPIMSKCVDKYEVREYVKSKNLSHILTELYQVVENTEDIKYNNLPNSFIMKSTTGGGGLNILICQDKSVFDFKKHSSQLESWLNSRRKTSFGREWVYDGLKPRIVIEELLKDKNTNTSEIKDYKFLCFNGEPLYVVYDSDRYTNHKRNIYDSNWNYIDVSTDVDKIGDTVPKPKRFSEMIEVARKLSEDFPFVRVDLYLVNEKIYFGELTFFPWSGYVQFNPDEFDYILGTRFKIPAK